MLTFLPVRIGVPQWKCAYWIFTQRGPSMDGTDKRKHRRNRTFKEGQIVFNSGSSVVDCLIRDRSESGAKLQMPAATVVPKSFALLSFTEGMLFPAQIMWRRGDNVGVEFIGAPIPAPSSKR